MKEPTVGTSGIAQAWHGPKVSAVISLLGKQQRPEQRERHETAGQREPHAGRRRRVLRYRAISASPKGTRAKTA